MDGDVMRLTYVPADRPNPEQRASAMLSCSGRGEDYSHCRDGLPCRLAAIPQATPEELEKNAVALPALRQR